MTDRIAHLAKKCEELGCAYREKEPMRLHTSFKTGGPADLYLEPDRPEQVIALLPFAQECGIPLHILGRGSNVLVSDAGIRGAVLALGGKMSGMRLGSPTTISCAAGAGLERLCRFALEHGLTGLEFAYGIPGSVGGAAFMNAGAYGGEMKDVLRSATYSTAEGKVETLCGDALGLSYRHSAFMEMGKG